MKTEDTTIECGGVMRCCLETVATEHLGKEVHAGDTSKCAYCKQTFTLVEEGDGKHVWKPDWLMMKRLTIQKKIRMMTT